jgi:hypothetical protein
MPNFTDVQLNSVSYVAFDNFEFTGMCWNDSPTNTNVHTYLGHDGTDSDMISYRVISNNYLHGWTHVAYNCHNGAGPVCGGADSIRGDTHPEVGTQIIFNVIDGSDSDDKTMNAIDSDAYIAAYNVIRHVGGENIIDNCHSVHDNLFEYINNTDDGYAHSDMWFCNGEAQSDNYFYNNLIRYIATEYNPGGGGYLSCIFWFFATPGYTDYIFNNVGHDVNCVTNCNNFNNPSSTAYAKIYNNTWESMYPGQAIWENQNAPNYKITEANNHYITNNGDTCAAVFNNVNAANAHVNAGAPCPDVFQTLAAANAQGYTSANDYQPTVISNATVGAGANEIGLVPAFGPAFASGTSNGCTYVSSNHSVSCPGITATSRASAGAWDAGAYVFAGGNQPAVPMNLRATVN